MIKPELYAPSTMNYQRLWEDDHISSGMLSSHLDPDENGATNNHAYVVESAEWITKIASPEKYAKLLDLGCGPGIYAEQFARLGYTVTGVDFSKRSVEYAKEQTTLRTSGIEYHYQNYLTIDYKEQFDVITIINKDYPVLSKADRLTLLNKIYQALRPGGIFILDALTPKTRRSESRTWDYYENSGFFYEKPHLLLSAIYQYDDEDKTELTQHIVIKDKEVKYYHCYNHYFTKETLSEEIMPIGFTKAVFYGDIAGMEYSEMSETVCGVFTK